MVERKYPAFSQRDPSPLMIFGSHVAKTGDIKGFVITEESGIAKGIRRIIAVTGHEAAEVTRVAQGLEEKLNSTDALDGKAKDAALKALTVVCLVRV